MRERRPVIGLGAVALAAVFWGLGGIFAALTYAPGLVLSFYRLWLGAILFLVALYVTGRRMTWAIVRATWLGGVLLAGDLVFFYSAVKSTSIVDVSVIGAFQPALVLVAARRLFNERMTRVDVAWIVLAMVGVTVTVLGPGVAGRHEVLGDLFALGALVCFSAYWLVSKHARQLHDATLYTAGVTLVAAVTVTPLVLLSNQSLTRVRASDWLWIALLAVVPGGAHPLMNWAHRFVDASVSSAISCLSPLVAALAAIPILGQFLSPSQVGGVAVGLSAIAVVAARHRQPVVPESE